MEDRCALPVYPRSFADSNADGVGDIPGIIEHLDHLEWLGVDGIWLSPVTVSPNADWGYDVSDFCAIAPEFGTLRDFDRLVAGAGERGIRVLMDIVPNHTSEQHPWFVDARSSRTAAHRDWYVWADGKEGGQPPNNWVSSFGGPGWTLDEGTGQYYFHNHLAEQPDLNWWNGGGAGRVRRHFPLLVRPGSGRVPHRRLQRHHQGRRAPRQPAGHRGRRLRDADVRAAQRLQRQPARGPRGDQALAPPGRSLRRATSADRRDAGPGGKVGAFYGDGTDELGLAFNFNFINAPLRAPDMRAVVEETEAALPPGAWPAWTGSNHDMFRFPTRWAEDDPAKVRLALLMLLSLRGTPVLYQGDEIGMANVAWPRRTCATRSACASTRTTRGATPAARPMQWSDRPGGGFTDADRPWLPLGDLAAANVAAQRDDPGSVLTLCRDLIAFRRRHPEFSAGDATSLAAPDEVWAWTRGERHVVVLNMSSEGVVLPDLSGTIQLGTDRARDLEVIGGALHMAAVEGMILESPFSRVHETR